MSRNEPGTYSRAFCSVIGLRVGIEPRQKQAVGQHLRECVGELFSVSSWNT